MFNTAQLIPLILLVAAIVVALGLAVRSSFDLAGIPRPLRGAAFALLILAVFWFIGQGLR
jgi:Na+-translocating ferredoxin:NAD+ oxidoreductase RnfA subunit